MAVQPKLKSLDFEPEPSTLPAAPQDFCFLARMYVGPADSAGEESFDVTVCSPEWFAERCREVGIVDARHHLVVNAALFDTRHLRGWLEGRVRTVSGDSWAVVTEKLSRFGFWEFEDYRP